jgi:Zn finger protein HypA/HybF involved in hydrogenase expression
VNQGIPKISLKLPAINNWLVMLGIACLLVSIGLGWVVKSFLIVVGFLLLTPVVAFFALQWWLKRNLIEGKCPVCQYEFTALNQTQCQCANCGEPLKVEQGHFIRLTPPGTIDVTAVEVSSVQQLED